MIVGIDLGTTNSLVACFKDGKVEVIPNRLGKLLTPSVVSIGDNDELLVGEVAKEYGYLNPDCSAKVFKRLMGTDQKIMLKTTEFTAEELSSFVLRSLKEDAEVYLGEKVEEAVISVPAYFNDNQRKATKKAGELAGLKVERIISEPTASAIAYGVGDYKKMERCMVLDLGGGTFDVSILEYYKSIMEVHAIAGDNYLGGEDFTLKLMELVLERNFISLAQLDATSLTSLYKAAEKAKCDFSKAKEVTVRCVINNTVISELITSDDYAEACAPLLDKLRKPIEKSLKDAGVNLDDIDRIILVGGATRLSIVRKYVEKITNIVPDFYVNPDTCVSVGAALHAAMKQREKQIKEIIFTDVCPFTLGTEVVRDNGNFDMPGYYLPIIERNTVIPVSKKERVYTAHENQSHVNVKILQGESRLARNNLFLGEIDVEVPVGPKGKEAIDITYTYDVNSLLEVEVEVVSTKLNKKIIIQNHGKEVDEKTATERFELLQYLKQNPREDEENLLALYRGNRVFEEASGKDKALLEQSLFNFEKIMADGSRLEIERTRKRLMELLDDMEEEDEKIFRA